MRPHRVPSEFVIVVSLIAVIAVIAVIGLIDAAVGGSPDLVVLFAAIAVLAAIAIGRSWSRRVQVPVRGDLVEWLSATAAAQGETVGDLADRALGAFRAGLSASVPEPAPRPARRDPPDDVANGDAVDPSGRTKGSAP